jgi:hypothetical protein
MQHKKVEAIQGISRVSTIKPVTKADSKFHELLVEKMQQTSEVKIITPKNKINGKNIKKYLSAYNLDISYSGQKNMLSQNQQKLAIVDKNIQAYASNLEIIYKNGAIATKGLRDYP